MYARVYSLPSTGHAEICHSDGSLRACVPLAVWSIVSWLKEDCKSMSIVSSVV